MSEDRTIVRVAYKARKQKFMDNIGFDDIPEINEISTKANQFLYPIHEVYKQKIERYEDGIYVADMKGIYTPIDQGGYGVIHVERLPLGKPAVYALTDLSKPAYIKEGNQIIIYIGVTITPLYGYRPISDNAQIKPVLGLSFPTPMRMLMSREGIRLEEDDREEAEEELGEYEN